MKRNQARIVNQATNDLNTQVANNNRPKFCIDITPLDLIRLISNGFWYEQEDIAKVARCLIEKYHYNFEQQFEVVGGLEQLNVFLNRLEPTVISEQPIFIIYNKGGNHWVTFCVTNLENKVVVLYKDSLGEPILEEIKYTIEDCLPHTIFKSHNNQEQTDGSSCGPMSLRNMEIILQGLKTDKADFINNFASKNFCSQDEVEQIKENFKDKLQENLSKKLVQDILNLVEDSEYNNFKEALNKFLNTCYEYVAASDPMEQYYRVLQEGVDQQEKDPNYKIDEKAIEEAKRNFLEHDQIKKIVEQQINITQDTKAEESNGIIPDIKEKFPEHMQKFTEIFDFLAKSKTDEKLEKALQEVSRILGINYGKIKQFFESKRKKEEIKIKQEEVVTPNSIEKIKENLPDFRGNPIPDTSEKTLEQLLSELVLDVKEDELSNAPNTRIDPKFSANALREQLKQNFKSVKAHYQKWQNKTEQDILDWAKNKKSKLQAKELYESIAVMDRANELVTGGNKLRNTQILSVLTFLQSKENKGKLCQISTGEGKTTIVSLLAALKVLQGKQVDVITSNQILAQEGKKDRENFYGLFGISVSTNNVDESYMQGPRACYTADIVYGSMSNFQFDYLRDSFEGLATRAKRKFSSVILDEVDSMLVDNGGYIAKLAGPFPGIDCLKYVHIKIWQELYKAEEELSKEFEQSLQNKAEELNKKVDVLEKQLQDDYEHYIAELSNQQVDKLKNKIKVSHPADIALIPAHLKEYAQDMVDKWIDNAIYAKYQCKENEQYVIKKHNDEDIVVPVDYQNTGVTLKNTLWSNGLHQFVQLKHNLHLTSESLTISFISNIGYIKLYNNNILGLTGTLGSIAEQNLLSTIYNVDYARIPTYKQKNFEEIGGIVVKNDHWVNCIALDSLILTYQGRSVLIICKTIKDLQDLEKNIQALKKLEGFDKLKIKTYPDEDSSHIVDEEISVGEVIIATNIAGRGTDFKTSLELEQKGGLHVCTSFLPVNQRVEDQAFGRTSRQGKAGTAQLIIKESDVLELGIEIVPSMSFETIKKQRDEIEKLRLEKVQNEELKEIAFQDSIFSKFSDLYRGFKQEQIQNPDRLFVIKDLKEYWAFWLQKQNFKNLDLNEVERNFQNFKQSASNILAGNITHNPYYSILQAEHLLSNNQVNQAKTALNHVIGLSKGHAELLYSAHIKLFEVSIETGNQLRERFKAAVKKVIFIHSVEKNESYKGEAKNALKAAKKALEKEIDYIKKHFIGENSTAHESNSNSDFTNILTHSDDNLLVKHIVSRFTVLNVFYQHTDSLLDQINDSLNGNTNPGLAISTRIPNYLKNLDPKQKNEKELKEAITDAELSEFGLIGLETIYALREVHDVPEEIIAIAQGQIGGGLFTLAVGVAFPPSMPVLGPIAGTLISEGICDIAIELISQGRTQFNQAAYIKGKCISYGIAVATMGIVAIAKSTTILDQAIKACKGLSNMLRKCPKFTSVCNKLANQVDRLGKYLEQSKHLIEFSRLNKVEQLKKLEKLKSAGELEKLKHLVGADKLAQLKNLKELGALSRFQIATKELVKIGKGTLQGVVGSVISEKLVTKGLEEILQNLKPKIKNQVQSVIESKLTKEDLKLVDEQLINEILIGSYGEIATDILKEVALGILRHSNNWKAKIGSIAIDTVISTTEMIQYTENFCCKLQEKLNKKKGNRLQEKVAHTEQRNSNIEDNSDAVIASITMQVTEKIYGLIIHLTSRYAHTFAINPIMHKVWNLFEGADNKKELSSEEQETINSFYEVIDDLETLGLKPGASIDEIKKAHSEMRKKTHPTKNPKDPEADEKFIRVNLAFDRLIKLIAPAPPSKPLALPSGNHGQEINDLETLGLKPGASIHEIEKARNKILYEISSNKNPKDPEATEKSIRVNLAFDPLIKLSVPAPPSKPLALPSGNHSQEIVATGTVIACSRIFNNSITRGMYYKTESALLVGGRRRTLPLTEKHYPSYEDRIMADEALKVPLAALRNKLNELKKAQEDFDHNPRERRIQLELIKHNNPQPCFGTVPDKEEMMIGVLEAKFNNHKSLKIMTVSGDNPFCDKLLITHTGNLNYTEKKLPFEWEYKGFKFVDPGKPPGNIFDVYNLQETTQKYMIEGNQKSKSCAAKKLMYELGTHLKKFPGLKIQGDIKMAEAWYRPANKGKFSPEQVEMKASCEDCERVLPLVTGKNFTGNGFDSHETFNYWNQYSKYAMEILLKLRLESINKVEEVTIISPNNMYNNTLSGANRLASEIISTINISKNNRIPENKQSIMLLPLNLHGKHWVGMAIQSNKSEFKIMYMDPEQNGIPVLLKEELTKKITTYYPRYQINFFELELEAQKYDNCGPEVIENFVNYLIGDRLKQEDSVAVHSILFENSLLSADATPKADINLLKQQISSMAQSKY